MWDRRKKGSHHRHHGHRHHTYDEEDRYNQDNQDENCDGTADQQSYLQPQTVSYSQQGAASYPQQVSYSQQGAASCLSQGTASYQASVTASYTSQGTASSQQSGISSYTSHGTASYLPQETAAYQQQQTASYQQPEATLLSGTWVQDSVSNSYPRSLNVRSEEESARQDQDQSSHNRDHRSRHRDQQGYARRPSVTEHAPVDRVGQRYVGSTGYSSYPQEDRYDHGYTTAPMAMTRSQQASAVARTGGQFHSTGEPSSYGFSASNSGGFPSNDHSVSGLSSRMRRVSISSESHMAPVTSESTPPSSYVGSPGGDFSEDAYSASTPTTQPRMSSRRNSFVPLGESAGTHRRRRSSDTSGSYHRQDSAQSGGLPSPGTGTRRTSTFPIPEDSAPGRDDDSYISQHGSDDELRRPRLTNRRRDSSVSFIREVNRTSEDKKNQKRQKTRTSEYLDKQRETNWWNNQRDPKEPQDEDDGYGGYGNSLGYPVQQ